jgi:selenocysteine lyase/cysteine desulfurase
LSSTDIGLALGVRALAVKRKTLPKSISFETGGGTTKLISKDWIIWADAPDKFEAGTPAIINIIAFARVLRMVRQYGKDIFFGSATLKRTAKEILYHDELQKYTGRELLKELRLNLIGRGIHVPTMKGELPFINLDNSASTPTFTPIWNAYRQSWRQTGQVRQEIISEVKTICSEVLGAPLSEYDLIFTSNTTEAINLVAESLCLECVNGTGPVVLNTLLEHSSNDLPWRAVPGCSLIRLSVDDDGFIDLNELESLLKAYNQEGQYGIKRIRLVAVSGASNVLGVCNNLMDISRITHQYGARLLVDAAQLIAHRMANMEECGIDYLAFSAHKVYAPFGSGVLIVRKGLLKFNSEELDLIQSSGEENVGGIAALGKALVLLQRIGMDLICEEEQALTVRALRGLAQIPEIKVYGINDTESPVFAHKLGVIAFGLKGMVSIRMANELAIRGGIGVRFGCHCAHIIVKQLLKVSPSLERFQRLIQTVFPKLRLPGLVRMSLGVENCEEDVDRLLLVLAEIANPKNVSTALVNQTYNRSRKEVKQQMEDFCTAAALRVYS